MGQEGATPDSIPEDVLNGFGQLLRQHGFETLPVSISMRCQPAFILAGSAADLEAYSVMPGEFNGIRILRKLIEHVTVEEAAAVCETLRRMRSTDAAAESAG